MMGETITISLSPLPSFLSAVLEKITNERKSHFRPLKTT